VIPFIFTHNGRDKLAKLEINVFNKTKPEPNPSQRSKKQSAVLLSFIDLLGRHITPFY